jgi:formylmethanofuran dehydrogenase subunit D
LVNKTYSVEEIFENDPTNDENVLMKIPEEIAEQLGWQPGDLLRVKWEEGSISITKVENGKE